MNMEKFWAEKIYGPAGFAKEDILEGKKALDAGCGQRKLKGAVGLDQNSDSRADIIHDMDNIPWPVGTGSFDLVLLNHSLEHAEDVLKILGEAHRILKPAGRLVIQVPYFRSAVSFTDPTHKHFFTAFSMDYFLEGTKLSEYRYVPFRFKKIGFWYGWPFESKNRFKQVLKDFVRRNSGFYDQYLSLLFPAMCLTWELEAIKNQE